MAEPINLFCDEDIEEVVTTQSESESCTSEKPDESVNNTQVSQTSLLVVQQNPSKKSTRKRRVGRRKGTFFVPSKLSTSLLNDFVDRRLFPMISSRMESKVMELTRQAVLSRVSSSTWTSLSSNPAIQVTRFPSSKSDTRLHGLLKIPSLEKLVGTKSLDYNSRFRIISGHLTVFIETERIRKVDKTVEIRVQSGKGYSFINESKYCNTFLYFTFQSQVSKIQG